MAAFGQEGGFGMSNRPSSRCARSFTKRIILFLMSGAIAGVGSGEWKKLTFTPALKCDQKSVTTIKAGTARVTLRITNSGTCALTVNVDGHNVPVAESVTITIPSSNKDREVTLICSQTTDKRATCAATGEVEAVAGEIDLLGKAKASKVCGEVFQLPIHYNYMAAAQTLELTLKNTGACPLQVISGNIKLTTKNNTDYPALEKGEDGKYDDIHVGKDGGIRDIKVQCEGAAPKDCAFDLSWKLQP